MNNNTNLNNTATSFSASQLRTINKEELVMRREELAAKKVADLRVDAKAMGIKGISKMKKEDLINSIVFFEELKRKEEEQSSKVDEAKVAATTVPSKKDLLKDIAFRVLSDTLLTAKDGSIIIRKDKNGKVVLKNGALFFRPTKVEVEEGTYMVVTKRLWAVLKDVCVKFCQEHDEIADITDDVTKKVIESAIDLMIKNDILTAVKAERNYIKLNPKTMEQEEKDVLNALWKKGGVKTQKLSGKDEGKILTTALNDEGKKVLNELYPCYSYRATAKQMNNMFAIIKSR